MYLNGLYHETFLKVSHLSLFHLEMDLISYFVVSRELLAFIPTLFLVTINIIINFYFLLVELILLKRHVFIILNGFEHEKKNNEMLYVLSKINYLYVF